MYRNAEYAVIDLETTGYSPKHHDRVVEVGIVRIDPDGNRLREYCTLINPHRDMGATHVHGISATDVAGAPAFRDEAGAARAMWTCWGRRIMRRPPRRSSPRS